jgi:hypothetical protein
MQTIFFVELYPSETRKLLERLINYVIYKVSFYKKFVETIYILIIINCNMHLFKCHISFSFGIKTFPLIFIISCMGIYVVKRVRSFFPFNLILEN